MPNIATISENVIRDVKRPSLVVDYNGNDFTPTAQFLNIINKAHDFLDTIVEHREEVQIREIEIGEGDTELNCDGIRYVERIDLKDSANLITRLTRRSMDYMRERYGANVDKGRPVDWTKQVNADESAIPGGVLFIQPASDGDYTATVRGGFYSQRANDGSSETWWSMEHPAVLETAIKRQIAIDLARNDTEIASYERQLKILTDGITQDIAYNSQSGPIESTQIGFGYYSNVNPWPPLVGDPDL